MNSFDYQCEVNIVRRILFCTELPTVRKQTTHYPCNNEHDDTRISFENVTKSHGGLSALLQRKSADTIVLNLWKERKNDNKK